MYTLKKLFSAVALSTLPAGAIAETKPELTSHFALCAAYSGMYGKPLADKTYYFAVNWNAFPDRTVESFALLGTPPDELVKLQKLCKISEDGACSGAMDKDGSVVISHGTVFGAKIAKDSYVGYENARKVGDKIVFDGAKVSSGKCVLGEGHLAQMPS